MHYDGLDENEVFQAVRGQEGVACDFVGGSCSQHHKNHCTVTISASKNDVSRGTYLSVVSFSVLRQIPPLLLMAYKVVNTDSFQWNHTYKIIFSVWALEQ